jgi:hypothetical protein
MWGAPASHALRRLGKGQTPELTLLTPLSPQPVADTHTDLVEPAEVQGAVAVNRGSQVLTVTTALHHLQLPDTAYVGQACLNLGHVQHLPRHTQVTFPDPSFPIPPSPRKEQALSWGSGAMPVSYGISGPTPFAA